MKRGDFVLLDGHVVRIVSMAGGYAVVEFRSNGARLGVTNPNRMLTPLPR